MTIQWEYHQLFLGLDDSGMMYHPYQGKRLKGDNLIKYFNHLGKNGWELVSLTPIIGHRPGKGQDKLNQIVQGFFAGGITTPATQHRTSTLAYSCWFKRPLVIIHCSNCNEEIFGDSKCCPKCGSKLEYDE